ncbi:MAG: FAD:protein FMN transferase [Aureispira sp.]|nr:FAD:protein FMN transferase [Aureispira sp.]
MRLLATSFLVTTLLVLLVGCENDPTPPKPDVNKLHGKTMGTTYSITYRDSLGQDFKPEVNSLLQAINQEVSTYIKDSKISVFNTSETLELEKTTEHFVRNFNRAKEIYQKSNGWFNPTVMPLVNYWGFGYTEKRAVEDVDSSIVDSLVQLVVFDSIQLSDAGEKWLVQKTNAAIQLDFSAIAKGDAVDAIGLLLEKKGIVSYVVEIGGEVRARGKTPKGYPWRAGINVPSEDAALNELQAAIELKQKSLATSGNYRNFHEVNGQKYAHTINPQTGYPEKNRLLSASVIAENCATADAFATAFMAMGLDKAWVLVNQLPEVEAYFIYSDENGAFQTKHSEGLNEALLD